MDGCCKQVATYVCAFFFCRLYGGVLIFSDLPLVLVRDRELPPMYSFLVRWPCNYGWTRGGLGIRRMIEDCTTQFAGKRRLSSREPGRPNRGGEGNLVKNPS